MKASLAIAYGRAGRTAEATALFSSIGDVTSAALASGEPKEMARIAKLYEMDSVELNPLQAATLYVKLGQRQKAFDQLDLAYKTHRMLPVKLRSPPLSTLRGDPRYTKLLARLNLR